MHRYKHHVAILPGYSPDPPQLLVAHVPGVPPAFTLSLLYFGLFGFVPMFWTHTLVLTFITLYLINLCTELHCLQRLHLGPNPFEVFLALSLNIM